MKQLSSVILVSVALLLALPAGPAAAVDSTGFGFTSDAGDYIGQGQSRAFNRDDSFIATWVSPGLDWMRVERFVDGLSTWAVDISEPGGLTPGTFATTTLGYPNSPSLTIRGEARGCSATGEVTISSVDGVAGTGDAQYGYLRGFEATFTHTCEGSSASLRGYVSVHNPSVEPALVSASIVPDPTARLDSSLGTRAIRFSGTWSCTSRSFGSGSIEVIPNSKNQQLVGGGSGLVACPLVSTPFTWYGYYYADDVRPGPADAFTSFNMLDEFHGITVENRVPVGTIRVGKR